MTPQDLIRPIRRSPLESVHVALGARWVDENARWPASYGDIEAESKGVATAAGIADLGPIDKAVLRGVRTSQALAAEGIAPAVGEVITGAGGIQAWCPGDDEVILLIPASTTADQGAEMGELERRLRASGAAVTDVSSGLSVLRLVGPATAAIMERACPVDLSPRSVANQRIVAAPVVGVRIIVARQDVVEAPGYTLLVARDLAGYAWGALLDLGRDLGLVPVGASAVTRG
jgi:heterotetrameric sarcosine oxidase gamma subunit